MAIAFNEAPLVELGDDLDVFGCTLEEICVDVTIDYTIRAKEKDKTGTFKRGEESDNTVAYTHRMIRDLS